MATALTAGHAAAGTDTGHTGPSSNIFVNEDVLIDFAHRAIHEKTVAAKVIAGGFFGTAPRVSYFDGCSTGGRQAVTAAQRYPDDFDGIVAGAPASHTSTQAFGQIWFYQVLADPASAMQCEKLTLLHDAACDQIDGAKDGVLENPLASKFDPQVLACKQGSDSASCPTESQVDGRDEPNHVSSDHPMNNEHASWMDEFEPAPECETLGWTIEPYSRPSDGARSQQVDAAIVSLTNARTNHAAG